MHDNLPPDLVLEWFSYGTPLMSRLRHSSPFTYAYEVADRQEIDTLRHHVVNHPELYPPRPGYDIWLDKILQMGGEHVNEFTRRYIPDAMLPEEYDVGKT